MHDVTAHDRGYETRTASFAATRLTIIIPTLNERDNIEPLVTRLISTLPDIAWEALFVDDYLPNVEGARDAGMRALHYTTRDVTLCQLTRLLL